MSSKVPLHIVVGGGPAGIFCSLELLSLGYRVLLIEKGCMNEMKVVELKNDEEKIEIQKNKMMKKVENNKHLEEKERKNKKKMKNSFISSIFPPQLYHTIDNKLTWTDKMTQPNSSFFSLFSSLPQNSLFLSRSLSYPQSFSLGGNSNINAMLTLLPGHESYSHYIEENFPDSSGIWSKKSFEEYSERVLSLIPLDLIKSSGKMKEFIDTFLLENEKNEKKKTNFYGNFYQKDSFSYLSTQKNNERLLLSSLLLEEKHSNLTICTEISVSSLLIREESNRVYGVRDTEGKEYYTENDGEVFLATGTLFTPQILIKTKEIYNRKDLFVDLPLSFPLSDHPILPVLFLGNWSSGWKNEVLPSNSVHGWVFLDENGETTNKNPSVQLVFVDGFIIPSLGYLGLPCLPSSPIYQNYIRSTLIKFIKNILLLFPFIYKQIFGILISVASPKSVGSISNNSYDPNFLTHRSDREIVEKSVETIRRNHRQAVLNSFPKVLRPFLSFLPSFLLSILALIFIILNFLLYITSFSLLNFSSPFFSIEILPFFLPLSFFFSYFTATYMHPVGSLPLKKEGNSLLHNDLRVKGLENLRICDGSVLPKVPPGGPAGIIMTLGVAAARFAHEDFSKR